MYIFKESLSLTSNHALCHDLTNEDLVWFNVRLRDKTTCAYICVSVLQMGTEEKTKPKKEKSTFVTPYVQQ